MAERRVLRAIARRLAHEHRCARHGGEDGVGQDRGRAVRPLVGFQLGVADLADLERAPAFVHLEPDWRALDRYNLADQLREVRHRSTELAGVHVQKGLFLSCGGPLVEVDGNAEIAGENIARDVRH